MYSLVARDEDRYGTIYGELFDLSESQDRTPKTRGLLKPLDVIVWIRSSVVIDVVTHMPRTKRVDFIWVVVDVRPRKIIIFLRNNWW